MTSFFSSAKKDNGTIATTSEQIANSTEGDPPANLNKADEAAQRIINYINGIAQGNLKDKLDENCSICDALKNLRKSMADKHMAHLDDAVNTTITNCETSISVAHLLREGKSIDQQTEGIAAATDEMVATVSQINSTTKKASENATEAAQIVSENAKQAQDAVKKIGAAADSVKETSVKMESLDKASEEIGSIVEEIENIADKTNLLALNATIEAARAGEAGKGFAVVANEVKSLSQQTAKATEDIRNRIQGLQNEMKEMVQSMNEGVSIVEGGKETVDILGESMISIEQNVSSVSASMEEIAGVLSQQTEASNEIAGSINMIKNNTKNNLNEITRLCDTIDDSQRAMDALTEDLGKIDIQGKVIRLAKSDHTRWKKLLVDMSVGRAQLSSKEMADHNNCRLGKWYNSIGKEIYAGSPVFEELRDPHKRIHQAGIEAVKCYENRDIEGTMKYIDEVDKISKEVIHLLDKLATEDRS